MVEGRRTPMDGVIIVVALRSSGCPVHAMVQAGGRDERPVAAWRDRAGQHGHQVHAAIVEQDPFDVVPVQTDEIRVKGRTRGAWMG